MNEVYRLSSHDIFSYYPYRAPERVRPESEANPTGTTNAATTKEASDSVEFSKSALAISREKALESAAARGDRLMRIRHMIDNHTYETPQKISATAGRLVEVLDLV